MSDEDRELIPLPKQPPPPPASTIRHQTFSPSKPEDRGPLNFSCPSCSTLIIEGMSEDFIPRAGQVFCAGCETWMSPSGRPLGSSPE